MPFGPITFWSISKGTKRRELDTEGARCSCLSSNGTQLLAYHWERLSLWMLLKQDEPVDTVDCRGIVEQLCISQNSQYFAAAINDDDDGSDDAIFGIEPLSLVRVWDRRHYAKLDKSRCWTAHEGEIKGVAISPSEKLVATSGTDGAVRLWNPDNQSLIAVLKGHKGAVRCVAFSPDGRILASGGDNSPILLWDLSSVQKIE